MSYEYSMPTEFPNSHPDWSGYPDPTVDQKLALALASTSSQPFNPQECTGGHPGVPSQDAIARGSTSTKDFWFGVPTEWLPEVMADQPLPLPQATAPELPINQNEEPAIDPLMISMPIKDWLDLGEIAHLPHDQFLAELMALDLAEEQVPADPVKADFVRELHEFSQALDSYDPGMSENAALLTAVPAEDYEQIAQSIKDIMDGHGTFSGEPPVDPPAPMTQEQQPMPLPVEGQVPLPAPQRQASQLRVPHQKGKVVRSKHYRDRLYNERSDIPQATLPGHSSSNHSSVSSSSSLSTTASTLTSHRASPPSDTSVESNNLPAAAPAPLPRLGPLPMPEPVIVPSQAPTPPEFIPAEVYARLKTHQWADVLFKQAEVVKVNSTASRMSKRIAHLGCQWINPSTDLACNTSPWGQPREHLKRTANRSKCGFFPRSVQEFCRHLLVHWREEQLLKLHIRLDPERWTSWNLKAIDAQAYLDKHYPELQLWHEGEKKSS